MRKTRKTRKMRKMRKTRKMNQSRKLPKNTRKRKISRKGKYTRKRKYNKRGGAGGAGGNVAELIKKFDNVPPPEYEHPLPPYEPPSPPYEPPEGLDDLRRQLHIAETEQAAAADRTGKGSTESWMAKAKTVEALRKEIAVMEGMTPSSSPPSSPPSGPSPGPFSGPSSGPSSDPFSGIPVAVVSKVGDEKKKNWGGDTAKKVQFVERKRMGKLLPRNSVKPPLGGPHFKTGPVVQDATGQLHATAWPTTSNGSRTSTRE